MSHPLRVFVNGRGLDVPRGATAIDAVRAFDTAAAEAVLRGERIITDSRGLPTEADTPIQAGAIFRLVPHRERAAGAAPDDEHAAEAP
jgi:hypothetical protein